MSRKNVTVGMYVVSRNRDHNRLVYDSGDRRDLASPTSGLDFSQAKEARLCSKKYLFPVQSAITLKSSQMCQVITNKQTNKQSMLNTGISRFIPIT